MLHMGIENLTQCHLFLFAFVVGLCVWSSWKRQTDTILFLYLDTLLWPLVSQQEPATPLGWTGKASEEAAGQICQWAFAFLWGNVLRAQCFQTAAGGNKVCGFPLFTQWCYSWEGTDSCSVSGIQYLLRYHLVLFLSCLQPKWEKERNHH